MIYLYSTETARVNYLLMVVAMCAGSVLMGFYGLYTSKKEYKRLMALREQVKAENIAKENSVIE